MAAVLGAVDSVGVWAGKALVADDLAAGVSGPAGRGTARWRRPADRAPGAGWTLRLLSSERPSVSALPATSDRALRWDAPLDLILALMLSLVSLGSTSRVMVLPVRVFSEISSSLKRKPSLF